MLVVIVCGSNNLQCRLVAGICIQVDARSKIVKDVYIRVGVSNDSMCHCLYHNKDDKHVYTVWSRGRRGMRLGNEVAYVPSS